MKKHILNYFILTLLIGSTIYFSYISYKHSKNNIVTTIEQHTTTLLKSFTDEVDQFSVERINELKLIAYHIPHLITIGDEIPHFLATQSTLIPYFSELRFVTPDGIVLAEDGTHFPVQQKHSFEEALKGNIMFSKSFSINEGRSHEVTAISVPIIGNRKEIIGVLSGIVNFENLIGKRLETSNLVGDIFLLKDQQVLFQSNENIYFSQSIPNSNDFLLQVDNSETGNWIDENNKFRLIKYERTPSDWVVVVDSSPNPALNDIVSQQKSHLLLAAILTSLFLLIFFYSERIRKREYIHHHTDLLTGLKNRNALEENIERKLKKSSDENITLFFIKVNHFSEIKERVGYSTSDKLLFEIGAKLKNVPNRMNIYRVGNDEFVITASIDTIEKRCNYAYNLIKLLEQPLYNAQQGTILMSISIGIRARVPNDQSTFITQDAMFAAQEASKKGANQYVYFTEAHAKISDFQRQIVNNVASVLNNDQLYLVFQPIYSVQEDCIVSFEALLRWNSPVLGEVSPADFIRYLEENDSIIAIGYWLLRETISQIFEWEQMGYNHFTVTINMSSKQLQHENFLSDVKSILQETNVNPKRLVFELTETTVAQNLNIAKSVLNELNNLGIQTAIDDFGTGYSSFAVLKELPFQYLKIDRAFVAALFKDQGKSKTILKGLIDIAQELNMITIVEGVETLEQYDVLVQLQADRIQGYLFSKPVPIEVATTFLNTKNLLQTIRVHIEDSSSS